jgi:signal transduction histidine kinase
VVATSAESILDALKIAYCITDRALKITQVGGYAAIARDLRRAVGASVLDLAPELAGSTAALADLLSGKRLRLEPPLSPRSGGGVAPVRVIVDLPHRDASGLITGLIHVVQAAGEAAPDEPRRTAQEEALRLLQVDLQQRTLELAAAQAELQSLSQMKAQFISTAAHELRSPLTAMAGYLELLRDGDISNLTDRQREYLSIVEGGARRLASIISDLLDVTRLESGRIALNLRPTNLGALIETAAAEHASEFSAQELQVILDLTPGLPSALCDLPRAAQIVHHLLSNAIKFTPAGGSIVIRLARAPEDGYLLLAVTDSGIGVPQAEHDKVFERFYRASNAVALGASGAGLGLHIVRSLVELHGGRVWLESDIDRGAAFFVTFAIADDPTEL